MGNGVNPEGSSEETFRALVEDRFGQVKTDLDSLRKESKDQHDKLYKMISDFIENNSKELNETNKKLASTTTKVNVLGSIVIGAVSSGLIAVILAVV